MIIKQYKLITSEVIVCPPFENHPLSDEHYVATKPLQLLVSPAPDGFRMALIPFMNQEVQIKKASVIAIADVPPPVEQEYIKMTTGIQLATNNNSPPNIKLVR